MAGNAVQIVDLGTQELARRELGEAGELVTEISNAAAEAAGALRTMVVLVKPEPRTARGAPVAPAVRAAVELARPAVAAVPELALSIDDTLATFLAAPELEVLVIAAILDAAAATRIALDVHERVIENRRWIELVRVDDRPGPLALELAPPSFGAVIDELASVAGGEVSLAPGRTGNELVIALPVA